MNNRLIRFVLFCFLPSLLFCCCKETIDSHAVIENVNIIDIETGNILSDQDVLITDNRISHIVPHSRYNINSKAVINGHSKYLIPGLWDMHEHMLNENWFLSQMPLLRINGITGFREMFGNLETAQNARILMQNDSLPFFRFVASGHIVDGKRPFWEKSISIHKVDDVNQTIDSLKNNGSDFIKVYSLLDSAVFFAIATRCIQLNIPFSGHVPYPVSLVDASNARMASMEHLYGFLSEACTASDSAMTLMKSLKKAIDEDKKEERKRVSQLYHSLVLNNFSKEKMRVVAQTLRKNNTHIVPTLVTLRGKYFSNDTSFTNDPRLKYMSDETRNFWKQTTSDALKNNTSTDWLNYRKRWELEQEIMKILVSERVPIMAGTDADNPYAFPGFSLHDELSLYVEFGMLPIQALQSATILPAKFLKLDDQIGSVTKGKLADLVLLEANPLDNIRNTMKVHTVIANGKIYGKQYIDSIIAVSSAPR